MSVPPPPGQFGPPPQQPPGGPNPWGGQQPWQAGPPPKRGAGKWIFGAIALVAVIAVTVAITVLVTRGGGGGSDGDPSTPPASDIASANDKGPVTIITEEPTCTKWSPISRSFSDRQQNGWDKRDASIPYTAWTPEQRAQYEAVGSAMRSASGQTVALVSVTPNRVVREFYEQFIAYSRSFADSVPHYQPDDEHLARVSVATAYVLDSICSSISSGSAGTGEQVVPKLAAPTAVSSIGNPANPSKIMTQRDSTCPDFESTGSQLDDATQGWRSISSKIRASDWTDEQRATSLAVVPVFEDFANKYQVLGERSSNPVVQDFSLVTAQYFRAYASALPTYTPTDGYLVNAGITSAATIKQACMAVST